MIYSADHSNDQNANFGYYTGVDSDNVGGIFYYDFSKPLVITRDEHQARKGFVKNIEPAGKSALETLAKHTKKKMRVGIDQSKLTVPTFREIRKKLKGVAFVDVSEQLAEIRAVKEKKEVEKIRKASAFTDRMMKIAAQGIANGETEASIAADMKYFLNKKGLSPAFEPIIAAGKNSLFVHYCPGNKRIRKFEMVIVDAGAKYEGYCSDMTRTFAVKPSEKQKQLYEKVLEAQQLGIKKCVEGASASRLYLDVRKKFGALSKFWPYGLGHGVGMDVHEKPFLKEQSREKLKPGMVVTVEPGLHVPGTGGCRVEDTVVVTKSRPVILTKSSYEWEL